MAFIMSLFSNAEMMGAASGAASSSASVCAADHIADPNESVPCTEASAPSVGVLSEPALPQVVEVIASLVSDIGLNLNPCSQCPYQGMCDSDECAMKCFSLDMNHAPTARGWRRFGL